MTTSLYTTVGDQSPSNSEAWNMNVGGHTLSATYGQVLTQTITYKKGESYPVTVQHTSTNRSDGPDYDYRAWIDSSANPGWTNGQTTLSGTNYFVTDPDGLLQKDYFGDSTDPTVGKTATLNIPGFDMNIDADNTQGFNAPINSPAEESIENNLDAGKVIWADNGDLNGNGIIDENELGVMGDYFVPVTLSLSQNIADANPSSITINFSYDTSVFALWTKDGTAIRTLSDKVQTGQEITASSLGLVPGGTVILYLEALKAYNSTNAKPISANVTVTGSTWSGKLTDTVRAVAVSSEKVTATINGESQSSIDNSLAITPTNLLAIPYSTGQTMDFSLSGFNPATAKTKSLMHWEVVQNAADAVKGKPTLVPDAVDNTKTHMKLDMFGSFNIVAYIDGNGNGAFDNGEQLRVLHLAIVRITVSNVIATNSPNVYKVTNANGKVKIEHDPNGGAHAVTMTAEVLLEGGGKDKVLGTTKILANFVQNGIGDSVAVGYGKDGKEGSGKDSLAPGVTFPILDNDVTSSNAFYDTDELNLVPMCLGGITVRY